MKINRLFWLSLPLIYSSQVYASCGSAFCTLNTHWDAQGLWSEPGLRLDMRYEWLDQDQLSGATSVPQHHHELETLNQNLITTLDYTFNETFGLSLSIPLIDREHQHEHRHKGAILLESWDFTAMGDLKLLGRMKLSNTTDLNKGYGIQVGFKLPTGDYKIANDEGDVAERSLQPGTGSTDAIVGIYFYRSLPNIKSRWFAQSFYTSALNKKDDFKTGNSFSFDLGYSYSATANSNLVLQLNYVNKASDSGLNAEPKDSGGNIVSLSPGFNYSVSHTTNIYAFLHHRLTKNLNGVQLSAKDSFVVGVSTGF